MTQQNKLTTKEIEKAYAVYAHVKVFTFKNNSSHGLFSLESKGIPLHLAAVDINLCMCLRTERDLTSKEIRKILSEAYKTPWRFYMDKVHYDYTTFMKHNYLIDIGIAMPLYFGLDHWATGMTPLELGIAFEEL